jgi:hypothetical protein
MLADLVSVGGKLYKEGLDPHHPKGKIELPTVCCHFDEVNEIAGPEFVPMVNKMGGSGFRITAYTQTIPDIEAKVGDKAKAEQILGNFNNVVMLRVKSLGTAEFMTKQLPKVNTVSMTAVSGVTDTAADGQGKHFVSNNQDRVAMTQLPMLEPSDIMQLPQGQAFGLLEGNRLYQIRIPLPDASADTFVPESLKAIGAQMRERYRTSDNWAAETDWLLGHPVGATNTLTSVVIGTGADPIDLPRVQSAALLVPNIDTSVPALIDLGPLPPTEDAASEDVLAAGEDA